MATKILTILMLACAVSGARPGDLDRNFAPELRAWVAPDHVTLAADGRAWIGGGFDRGDGYSTGDLLRLGANGGVENEPAPGYLGKKSAFSIGSRPPVAFAPFLLASGDFLLPGESGGWLRMTAAGEEAGNAFHDRLNGETIEPQFERDGKLWVIRHSADGLRKLERRNSADGSHDSGFAAPPTWPGPPSGAVPGPAGTLWVLTSIPQLLYPYSELPLIPSKVFQIDGTGALIGTPRALQIANRSTTLVAGPAGAFRIQYGSDLSRWNYWPSPDSTFYRLEWYSPAGVLQRRRDFQLPIFTGFCWAESADGSFVATDNSRSSSGLQAATFNPATLRRFGPDGVPDPSFQSPGSVRSVKALPEGKWLVDGLRRLNADGSEDATWSVPQLDRPAQVTVLIPLPDGRVLTGGNFATVDGIVGNRLAILRANGTVDPSFAADDRIGEWRSVAVSSQAIYVVTTAPVAYGDRIVSNLVKLGLDGALDENFRPTIRPTGSILNFPFSLTSADGVHATARGEILVVTYSGWEVATEEVFRLNATGAPVSGFTPLRNYNGGFGNLLPRSNGKFVRNGVLHRADGSIERDLTEPDAGLQPLCEYLDGVLFRETRNGPQARLRLWTNRGWAAWFRAPALGGWGSAFAAPGEFGTLYLSATIQGGAAAVHRLLPSGRVDGSFRSPAFGNRERQIAGDWWKAEESGSVDFDPAAHETRSFPQALLWHPASRRLWTGGNFNVVDGQPRDGLARIHGGFSWFR